MDQIHCIILILLCCLILNLIRPRERYNPNKIQAYVLYIPKRFKAIKKIMEKLDVNPIYVQGLDKKHLTLKRALKQGIIQTDWYDYSIKGNADETFQKKPVNPGRVACHLGHLKILKLFLKSSSQYALIFEDDIYFTPGKIYDRKYKLKTILENIPPDAQIIYLSYCYEFCDLARKYNDIFLHAVRPLCRHFYLVSQEGAQIILDNTLPMYNTGDKMVGNLIANNILKGYLVNPKFFSLNQNRQQFKSNLNNNGSLYSCQKGPRGSLTSLNEPPKNKFISTHQILNSNYIAESGDA